MDRPCNEILNDKQGFESGGVSPATWTDFYEIKKQRGRCLTIPVHK